MTDIISLLTPLHDVLLVRRDPGQEKIGTIYLSDSSQLGRSQTGVVEKAGDLAPYYLGKRIIFGMNAGISPKVSGGEQEVVILRPSDVVGVIEDPSPSPRYYNSSGDEVFV